MSRTNLRGNEFTEPGGNGGGLFSPRILIGEKEETDSKIVIVVDVAALSWGL